MSPIAGSLYEAAVIVQIVVVDMVFAIDSVLTAVGMTGEVVSTGPHTAGSPRGQRDDGHEMMDHRHARPVHRGSP